MKHTLKSLLFTTVITLPTVFGAACADTDDDKASQTPTTTAVESKALVPRGRATAAAAASPSTLFRLDLTALNVIVGHLQRTTENLGGGDTKDDLQGKIVISGFLGSDDLAALKLASRGLLSLCQPILDAIKAWGHLVIPRLLQDPSLNHQDTLALAFLGINTGTQFENILNIAFAVKYWTASMTSDKRAAIVAAIDGNEEFTFCERMILNGLLPQATSRTISFAATALIQLGRRPAYSDDRVAKLYQISANHSAATPEDIRNAAGGLRALGFVYYERAAKFYERSTCHKDPTPAVLSLAADGLAALGFVYYERAAKRHELSAHHQTATPFDIKYAADRLKDLGPAYYKRAAKLYELSASHKDATPADIGWAADELKRLGSPYSERAAALLKKFGLSE